MVLDPSSNFYDVKLLLQYKKGPTRDFLSSYYTFVYLPFIITETNLFLYTL